MALTVVESGDGVAGGGRVASRTDGKSPYLSVREAAALLGLTGAGVTRWLREGTLRGRKLGVRRWRVERASVEAALPDPAPAPQAPAEMPERETPPVERVLALLPALSLVERVRVARAALDTGDEA